MTTGFASANDTQEQKASVLELAKNVYGYVSDFDPNCGFIVGDEGVMVIDCRATPALAREMIEDIRKVTDKPLQYIFLTHYHAVRVFGASAFGVDAVFASTGTAKLIEERGEADRESEIRRFPRLFKGAEEIPGLTRPRITFDKELTFRFAGREVQLKHIGRGHTAGDTIAWLPQDGVLFAGDLVENGCGVYTGDAYMTEWPETLERLREIGAHTMVPGRGAAVRTVQEVSEAIDSTKSWLFAVLGNVRYGIDHNRTLKQIYETTHERMLPGFGDWPIFEHCLPFDVARAYDELRGHIHPRIWTAERDADLWRQLKA